MTFEDKFLVVVGDNEVVADLSRNDVDGPVIVILNNAGEIVFERKVNAMAQMILVECVMEYCARRH